MIEVRTIEQLTDAIRNLRADHARGLGTMELIRSLEIDPLTELRGGDWRRTNFASCNLKGVDFSECRLAFCDFTRADVAGAVFYGADLFQSTIHLALNLSLAYLSDGQWRVVEDCRRYHASGENGGERVFRINQNIHVASSFQSAVAQFKSILTHGLRPDHYSAGLLISRANNPGEAWEAFEMVELSKCPLSNVVFIALASKMKDTTQIREVMQAMLSKGFTPGAHVYNTLLSRTKNLRTGLSEVLSEMQAVGINRDNVTYDILMRRTNFDGQKNLLTQLVSEGLHPGTAELNILLRGARNEDEADEAIEIGNELDIRRDSETYALLAAYKLRSSAFENLIEDMTEDDVSRDVAFYRLAFTKAKSFSDACFLYGHMKIDETPANEGIYVRLARLAQIPRADFDPSRTNWPIQAIESLILRVGAPADILAAGLNEDGNK